MNRRTLLGAALALLVGGGVYALWPKPRVSPEDEIRALVARAVAAAERRDPAGVLEEVSESFRGPSASSKAEVKQVLLGQFFRAQAIVVLNPSLEVELSSPTRGRFKGTFLLGRDGQAPEATSYEIEAELEKTSDGWEVVSARWNR